MQNSFFKQTELERLKERYDQSDKESKELSKIISQLRSEYNFTASGTQKIDLERNIEFKENRLQECEKDLKSLEKQIEKLEQEIHKEQSSEEASDGYRGFAEMSPITQQKSEVKEDEFSLESKLIQELQRDEKQQEPDKISEHKRQDIHANSLLKDDEIQNTILYTVTFFPQLSVSEFDQVVEFLLEGRTKEFTSTSEVVDEEGKVKKIETKEIKELSDLWRNPETTTYKDELLNKCYLEPKQLPNSFQQVIDFTENYSYLREEFIQAFKKSGFYSKDKFQKVQSLIFWRSEKVAASAIIIAVNMALSDPNLYGENFLLGIINNLGIINSLGEDENQKLLNPLSNSNSLVSEQSLEQTILTILTIFNIQKQQQESEKFKSFVCERLAALIYKMEENPDLKGVSDNFLKKVMQSPFNRYDVVLEICKYLRSASDFDELYWIKQILARGDAENRDKAYNFLFYLLKQSKHLIYQRLKAIEEWLPKPSQKPDDYSTLNQYALQIFVEYSLEQTSNFKVEYYGEYPSRYSLFYPLQDNEIEDKLDTLVSFLFCLYLDNAEKYHPEKLALSYIVDKNVNAMNLISFLIAQWYIILCGIEDKKMNPEASQLFEKLLTKIIEKVSPYLRKELLKAWVRFGKFLLNEPKSDRKMKQEFLARYNLVKQLKDQFTILEKSIV